MRRIKNTFIIIFLSLYGLSYSQNQWTVCGKVLTARANIPLDNIAVKDASIVHYNGKYHLFFTAKSVRNTENGQAYNTGCAYTSAATIEELNSAERFSIDSIAEGTIIAPQIFYFEPQRRWYLIGHTPVVNGQLNQLKPVYVTNNDIENPYGWSEIKEILTGKNNNEFWIDFWIICDNNKAYMFYSNQKGSVLRLECALNNFPHGFDLSIPEVALTVNNKAAVKPWKMFEAAHIYYVKKDNKYLALLEGAYQHPDRENDVDSRNRFIFAMTADSITGSWKRFEMNENEFLADAANLYHKDGSHTNYTQVSHPELIRSGYNQKMEIEDYNLTLLFQSFDGSSIPSGYNYNELPWELAIMKNY